MMRRFAIGLVIASFVSLAQASDVSVAVNGKTVRLWGIDAPAAGETCTTTAGKVWPCGARVRDQLRAVFTDEKPLCEEKPEGFVLCRASGLDVGLLLVKEGLAKSTGPYAEIEARARSAKVGLWE